ncbi:MAG TPA: hypothetical protein VM187_12860 [Niastella sp.]|nr:hypothetical protein [Niastella sp.]
MIEKYIDRQAEYNSQFDAIKPMGKRLNFIAFLCGDISVTMYLLFTGLVNDLLLFGAKLITTLLIGAAGGIAGMAGKEIYPVLRTALKRKFKKKPPNE